MIEYVLFVGQFAAFTILLFLYRRLQMRLAELEQSVEADRAHSPEDDLEEGVRELIAELKRTAEEIGADLSARSTHLEAVIKEADARLLRIVDEALAAEMHIAPDAGGLVSFPTSSGKILAVAEGADVHQPQPPGGSLAMEGRAPEAEPGADASSSLSEKEAGPFAGSEPEGSPRRRLRVLPGGEETVERQREEALRLASEGWDNLDIAREVGLGREEIELLRGLYGRSGRRTAAPPVPPPLAGRSEPVGE